MLTAHSGRHNRGEAELTAYQDLRNDQWVLKAHGAFDAATTSLLEQALDQACQAQASRIVIDCSAVTFADIAFLRALLGTDTDGTRVVLAAPSLAVCRLLDATENSGRFGVA